MGMTFIRYLAGVLCAVLLCSGAAAEVLRVGLSADYPPLHFRQDGRIVGIEVDNSRAVGEFLGRRVELVELPFERLIPALLDGQIDVIMSGMSVTAERSRQVAFTDPYLRVGQMAIMHRDKVGRFSQPWAVYREGVRIGVEPGTTGASFAERELKDAVISYFPDPASAFEGLRKDRIDLYIHDAPTSWQLAIGTENDDLLSLYAPLTEEMLAWAVRPADSELALELNRALGTMKSNGTLQYILNRWIPVRIEVR
jgi:ABC-type amino acid transport substrate-binding protein